MEEKLLPTQVWGVIMLSKNTLKTVCYQIGLQASSTPILQDPGVLVKLNEIFFQQVCALNMYASPLHV